MKLRWKIILPFLVTLALLFGLSAHLNLEATRKAQEQTFQARAREIAQMVARRGAVVGPVILNRLQEIQGMPEGVLRPVELVLLDKEGHVLAETSNPLPSELRLFVQTAFSKTGSDFTRMWRIGEGEKAYRLAFALVREREKSGSHSAATPLYDYADIPRVVQEKVLVGAEALAYLVPEEQVALAERPLVKQLAFSHLLGFLAALAAGTLVALGITRPIERLVKAIQSVREGRVELGPNPSKTPELKMLWEAFQSLTRDLATQKEAALKNERLVTLGKIAGTLAHEIRNPLTAMKMTVQLLLSHETTPTRQEPLQLLEREIQRLDFEVEKFLLFARPATIQRTEGDVAKILDDLFSLLQPQIRHTGIHLKTFCPATLPGWIDGPRLNQVFLNLIQNALQAMSGGGSLEVRLAEKNGQAEFRLLDTGIGFSAEEGQRLFESFYSLKPEGTGLGLVTSREILQKHGGNLTLQSNGKGQGCEAIATFSIREA